MFPTWSVWVQHRVFIPRPSFIQTIMPRLWTVSPSSGRTGCSTSTPALYELAQAALDTRHTVDGRNLLAPVDRWLIPSCIGFQPSKVVQDFFYTMLQDGSTPNSWETPYWSIHNCQAFTADDAVNLADWCRLQGNHHALIKRWWWNEIIPYLHFPDCHKL